jgi:FlaA1/EpsC-like NDP-sugar epimerase
MVQPSSERLLPPPKPSTSFLLTMNWMRVLLALMDATILNICILASMWLRFGSHFPAYYWHLYLETAPAITILLVVVARSLGLYHRVWQYASTDAALAIVGTTTATVGLSAIIMIALGRPHYPRSVMAMTWGFATLAIGASRFSWRAVRIRFGNANGRAASKRRILVYGAGQTGVMLARQARENPQSPYYVVGFLDDDPRLKDMLAGGVRVRGSGAQLEEIARRFDVEEVILAMPDVEGPWLEQILERGRAAGLRMRTFPRLLEILDGEVSLPKVRDIRIADLLGRNPECPSLSLPTDYVAGRTVLVTGAGGSIGSEICRQLCRYHPARLVLLGRGENRIHAIYYELKDQFPHIHFEPVIANITDRDAVEDVLRRFQPGAIFHAAAHKHVFLMECNPIEAAWNNVLGTAALLELANQHQVERFVMISSDKATSPTSVMGATKSLCERLVSAWQERSQTTRYIAVRFGNVLGSAGSVVPIFQALAEAGKPLTVTDPEATRYFMTIEEASFLVLQAGARGVGGEVFVLDMGDPIRIVDVARTILRVYGRNTEGPEAIQFIGLRAGEKLHETLTNPEEVLEETDYARIRRVRANEAAALAFPVEETLEQLREAIFARDDARVLDVIAQTTGAVLTGCPIQLSQDPDQAPV